MTVTKISQEGRFLQAEHPLGGPDDLVPLRLAGTEGLSRPFHFAVDFLSPVTRIAPAKLLGKGIGLMMHVPGHTRFLHGLVSHWVELGIAGTSGLAHYRAELVPWLWFLTLSADCRTFENKTVLEIVEAVFKAHGFSDFKFSVGATPPKLPYVVQYQESDFHFVSRLLEEHGLHYAFDFLRDKHVLVITDRVGGLIPAGDLAELPITPSVRKQGEVPNAGEDATEAMAEHVVEGLLHKTSFVAQLLPLGIGAVLAGGLGRVVEHLIAGLLKGADTPPPNSVTELRRERRVHTETVSTRDFHLLRVGDFDFASSRGPGVFGDRFAFLGDLAGTPEAGEAKANAKRRIEVEETTRDVFRGSSTAATFTAGTRVQPQGGLLMQPQTELHLTDVVHVASAGDLLTGDKADLTYTNKFVAIPVGTPYRPERRTPRPSVRGTQTAKVVGEGGGGQIDVDANGCVLLEFPWDRGDGMNGKSKHRVHVASLWSGTGWGEVHLPRVGQLVLVEFLEGDPDRPIVTGRVYSREHAHPYTLPANKTQSGIKSRTVGGGEANFNELRFEDKAGEEHVFLQAEKDHETLVKHDETRTVRHDRTTTVLNHDKRTVGGKDADGNEVGGNDTVTVTKGNRDVTVSGGNLTTTVSKGHMTTTVSEGNETHEVTKGTQTVTVEGNVAVTVKSGNHETTLQQGDHATTVQAGNAKLDVTAGKYEVSAAQKIVLDVSGSTVTITPTGIELKTGASSVKLGPSGIEIKGPMVKIDASGMAEVKSAMVKVQGDGMLQLKAPMSQLNGDGMLMAKGGITMIN